MNTLELVTKKLWDIKLDLRLGVNIEKQDERVNECIDLLENLNTKLSKYLRGV